MSVAVSSWMRTAPATVPPILIRPPLSGVPPTTTAVIADSSIRLPSEVGSLACSRADASTPATAARTPEQTYTRIRTRRTGRPASCAAGRLSPMASSCLPNVVRRTVKATTSERAAAISTRYGTPSTSPDPSDAMSGSWMSLSWGSSTRAIPRPATIRASVATMGWTPTNAISEPLATPTTIPPMTAVIRATHTPYPR